MYGNIDNISGFHVGEINKIDCSSYFPNTEISSFSVYNSDQHRSVPIDYKYIDGKDICFSFLCRNPEPEDYEIYIQRCRWNIYIYRHE